MTKRIENCCIIECFKKAVYQIGDKDKPCSESTFVCDEHKNTLAYDWISDYAPKDICASTPFPKCNNAQGCATCEYQKDDEGNLVR